MSLSPLHKRQKVKNYTFLVILLLLAGLLFFLTVVKFKAL